MIHPEKREFNRPYDVLLKIADIFYFYKTGKADKERTYKRLNFLFLICKRTFPEHYEELRKDIEKAISYLNIYDKEAYEKWLEYLKTKEIKEEKMKSLKEFFR